MEQTIWNILWPFCAVTVVVLVLLVAVGVHSPLTHVIMYVYIAYSFLTIAWAGWRMYNAQQ